MAGKKLVLPTKVTPQLRVPCCVAPKRWAAWGKIKSDLAYYKGFLDSVMKKLSNERFVQNAPPAVIELERKKKSDTESKIKSLEEALKSLNH